MIDEATAVTYLNVDKRRFERIMTNLVANAERHGGARLCVSRWQAHDWQLVHIAVEDQGPKLRSLG